MMNKMLLAALLAAISMGSQAALPTLAGQTITAYVGSLADPTDKATDLGNTGPFVVVDGPSDTLNFGDFFTLDVDGESFTVKFNADGIWSADSALYLVGLSFVNDQGHPVGSLTGVTPSSNLSNLPVSVGHDSIIMDFSNLSVTPQSYFSGKFQVSSVPEPGTMLLSGLGLMAIASLRLGGRRRSDKV